MVRVALPALAALCVATGLFLLALNLVGIWLPPAEFEPQDGAPPDYRLRSQTRADAEAEFAALLEVEEPGLEEARALSRLVADRMAHEDYVLKAWDNWYLWLRGLGDPMHRHTLDAELLWKRGQGQCHQAAIVYAERARQLGFEPRMVWMDGHVIAQVEIEGLGWRAVDPDLDIVWPGTVREIAGSLGEDGIARTIAERGLAESWARSLARIYASTDDNRVSFVPHLPIHARAEQQARIPKWAIPALLLVLGLSLGPRARRAALEPGASLEEAAS